MRKVRVLQVGPLQQLRHGQLSRVARAQPRVPRSLLHSQGRLLFQVRPSSRDKFCHWEWAEIRRLILCVIQNVHNFPKQFKRRKKNMDHLHVGVPQTFLSEYWLLVTKLTNRSSSLYCSYLTQVAGQRDTGGGRSHRTLCCGHTCL